VETLADAERHAERLGYPLLIKATAEAAVTGFAWCVRPANSGSLWSARAEAFKAFGDPTVFMEQLVQGARHVEVQSSPTTTEQRGPPACATAPSSAATRKFSRKRPRRRFLRSKIRRCAKRRCA
jgi:hypothetical protein